MIEAATPLSPACRSIRSHFRTVPKLAHRRATSIWLAPRWNS